MSEYKIVLGSTSPRRREILQRHGFRFSVIPADINEDAIRTPNPRDLPLTLAKAKLEEVKTKVFEPSIIVCADTVVLFREELREKPQSIDQLKAWLESYSENSVEAHTSVVIHNTETLETYEIVDFATAHFKKFPESLVEELLTKQALLGASGGLIIEMKEIEPFIEKIEGDPECIQGLPGQKVKEALKKFLA